MTRRLDARRRWSIAVLAGALLVLALPRAAGAQPISDPPAEGGSWDDGASLEARQAALALFARGNIELTAGNHAAAVALYREALTRWDHPAIHYNLALALIHTDDPVALHAALAKARAHGPAPIGDDRFARAGDFLLLANTMIAPVEITLPSTGVLLFDGREVLSGPGTWKAIVRAGCHEVRAQAEGYAPTTAHVCIPGGAPFTLTVNLYTDTTGGYYVRKPLPRWTGYSLLTLGVASATMGVISHRADDDRPAFALYGAGATLAITGLTILLIERPRYRHVALTPAYSPTTFGLAATGRF